MDFLPEDRRLFRPLDSLGAALCEVARNIAPVGTAKALQRRWRLDHSTAENVTKRLASGTTIVKAVKAEGSDAWKLWDAIGELIIGESRAEYEERQLQLIIAAGEDARRRLQLYRDRQGQLEARAARLLESPGR